MTTPKFNLKAEPGKQEVVITRILDAPRELVFQTMTDPASIPHWWGDNTRVDKMEVRQGGIWRFVSQGGDGNEYAFNGVYHAVIAPERLVNTFEFEGMPGHVLLETITFEDYEGKTRLTNLSVFQSIADRDGMLSSGMEWGAAATMDRLEALLKKVASVS